MAVWVEGSTRRGSLRGRKPPSLAFDASYENFSAAPVRLSLREMQYLACSSGVHVVLST